MESWDAPTIYQWLINTANLPENVAQKFLEKDIDGCVLLSLSDSDLKDELDLGFAHRRKLLLALEKYRDQKLWTFWVTPPKGEKVMIRGIDPAQYVDQLKVLIRDHQELGIADFVLTEFSLKIIGSPDALPSDTKISSCLKNGDNIGIAMHRDFETSHSIVTSLALPHHSHTHKLQATALVKDKPPSPRNNNSFKIVNDPPRSSPDVDVRSDEEENSGPRSDEEEPEPTLPSEQNSNNTPFYVVGIGASAGGLEALESFFANMSINSGMAFIVVQHLSPNYKSMMTQLLAKHTAMVINKAEDMMKINQNQIYLIQPSTNMYIERGMIRVNQQDRSNHILNMPINVFFKSLGMYHKVTNWS